MPSEKLHPRLRHAAAKPKDKLEPVFIEVANPNAARWLERRPWVRDRVRLVDHYYTARVPQNRLAALEAHPGVIEVEAVTTFRPHLDQSVPRIHGRTPVPPGRSVPDGKGVLIGIVDYGIDFRQKDFQNPTDGRFRDAHNPNGITRIAYLWDQDLKRRSHERAPRTFGYGVEYTSRDIDRALRAGQPRRIRHDPLKAEDIQGHGTHVAGIVAGNGTAVDEDYPEPVYVGVAPAATIVFVSLSRSQIVRQVETRGATLANSINIAHAVAYCFAKADELGMPCVVNLSLGANGGGHDGDMVLEWIIDALLEKAGRAVVVAAGNEDGKDLPVHATGKLPSGGRATLRWKVGKRTGKKSMNDPSPNEMEVWYSRGNAIEARLVAPDGTPGPVVAPGERRSYRCAAGETVRIVSDAKTPWTGAARIHIEVTGAKKRGIRCGTWPVELRATKVAGRDVRFDAWIERTLPANGPAEGKSHFATYNPRTTINVTTPGTSRRAITVASCTNDERSLAVSDFSGRGPTRDARLKPELTAPGEPVMSTNAGGGWRREKGGLRPVREALEGTSMAAPHVAGVIARMLGRNPRLKAGKIREILVRTATPPPGGAKWHPKWGYGEVNAARAVAHAQPR